MSNIVSQWYTKYSIHLMVWILYMVYETLSVGLVFNNFASPVIYTSHYLIFILFFYLHADVFLPIALKKKSNVFWTIPLLVIFQWAAYLYCQYGVSRLLILTGVTTGPLEFDQKFVIRNSYRAMLYMGFATGYYFLSTYIKERKKSELLERDALNAIIKQQHIAQELTIAQNAFLKAQINPHFLFNTLDFVYHNVNQHSVVAGEAIIRLSDMMRFALDSDQMQKQISLVSEIEQVENLIYLHQMRKDNQLYLEFSYAPAIVDQPFIPLVLLTLVENMFKHGDLAQPDYPALIQLNIENEMLCLQTINLINRVRNVRSHHSGLNNIRKRLQHAYGEHILFSYETTPADQFQVKISVPLQLLALPS